MKKSIVLVFILIFLVACTSTKSKDYSKEVILDTYYMENGEEKLIESRIQLFDWKDNLVSETIKNKTDGTSTHFNYVHIYDSEDKLISLKEIENDVVISETVFHYKDNDLVYSKKMKGDSVESESEFYYEGDSKYEKYKDSEASKTIENISHSDGTTTILTSIDQGGRVKKTKEIFDDKNRIISKTEESNGHTIRRSFHYNNDVKTVTLTDGSLDYIEYTQVTDEYNNTIQLTEFDHNKEVKVKLEFEFVYDANGEWTSRAQYHNDILIVTEKKRTKKFGKVD